MFGNFNLSAPNRALSVGIVLATAALSLAPSFVKADRLDDMISPISHPVNFEDPRQSTELRPIYAYHELDDDFVTGGGNVQIYALQARFQVSDDLSIIATKDGYVDLNSKSTVAKDEGFANIAAGVKYSFFKDESSIISGGLRYEILVGEKEVLQGEGDGVFNPFVSAAVAIDNINLMAGTGFRIPIDNEDSSFYDLDLHASYKLGSFYPLVELGVIHVIDGGERLPIADEGEDFFNLGSSDSDGETLVTMAVGARYRITDDIDVGAAWEFPLNEGPGTRILDNRVTVDLIYRFCPCAIFG